MATGQGLIQRARPHIGEKYVNVQVPKNNPNWTGPWDCAEFASWLVFQEGQILYGCTDNTDNPADADAYTGAWRDDSASRGIRVPVEQAAGTVGGIVLRYPPSAGKMGHIAVCDGSGGTVEAKGAAYGVVADTVHDRRWDTGVLIPGFFYDAPSGPIAWKPPVKVYHIGAPNMDAKVVRDIQGALMDARFNPGPIDGLYGGQTAAAVAAFQASNGLVADGEVGPVTAKALGVKL